MLDSIANKLDTLVRELRPIEKSILDERLWVEEPRTLEDIGKAFGLTRERVRRKQNELEQKIEACFNESGKTAILELAENVDVVDAYSQVVAQIRRSAPHASPKVHRILIYSLIDFAAYTTINGVLISKHAIDAMEKMKSVARENADACGLIDREQLIDTIPGLALRRHFRWFLQQCGLREIFGMFTLRVTRKAKLKAALLALGRPATRPELAEMCSLTNKIASAALSSMPEIVRISRTQWALADWGLHEYRGIVEEIVDYISRAGGVAEVEPLIEDIADQFDVKRWSVRAYMQTPKFQMRDGLIQVAPQTSQHMKPLSEVVHGYGNEGLPYWTFPVLERYFRGYSIVGVPFEIAAYLGCPRDGATTLKLRNIPDCRHLTIQWYLSSTTKASIGFVRDALERQNLAAGQMARLTLVGEREVELHAHTSSQDDVVASHQLTTAKVN